MQKGERYRAFSSVINGDVYQPTFRNLKTTHVGLQRLKRNALHRIPVSLGVFTVVVVVVFVQVKSMVKIYSLYFERFSLSRATMWNAEK